MNTPQIISCNQWESLLFRAWRDVKCGLRGAAASTESSEIPDMRTKDRRSRWSIRLGMTLPKLDGLCMLYVFFYVFPCFLYNPSTKFIAVLPSISRSLGSVKTALGRLLGQVLEPEIVVSYHGISCEAADSKLTCSQPSRYRRIPSLASPSWGHKRIVQSGGKASRTDHVYGQG